MELYHYRSIETALLEIGKGAFRFSSPSEVNDPVDGFTNIYWLGDAPAWEGLLRNYVCSLYHAIELYLLEASKEELEEHAVLLDIHSFDNVPLGDVLVRLGNEFLRLEPVKEISRYYAALHRKCEEKELKCILLLVHGLAFQMCINTFFANGCISKEEYDKLCVNDRESEQNIYEIAQSCSDKGLESVLGKMTDAMDDAKECGIFELQLGNQCCEAVSPDTIKDENQRMLWLMIYIDFPSLYIKKIKKHIFPESYMLCMSSRNDNSVMWGNYANCHKGVCLVYKTTTQSKKECLKIKTTNGHQAQQAMEISYDGTPTSRNFFTSLGRFSMKVTKSWLTGTEGVSVCLDGYERDTEAWRKEYWACEQERFLHKLNEWQYEEEYRFLLSDMLNEYKPKESRTLDYDKDALVGVVFGAATTADDKYRVFKAVNEAGFNVKFFQAEYSNVEQKIVIRAKYYHPIKEDIGKR